MQRIYEPYRHGPRRTMAYKPRRSMLGERLFNATLGIVFGILILAAGVWAGR